jgi:hypothetical protein
MRCGFESYLRKFSRRNESEARNSQITSGAVSSGSAILAAVRDMSIRNTKEGVLYHLVFATKDPLGDKIWSSIVQTDARGQRSLF